MNSLSLLQSRVNNYLAAKFLKEYSQLTAGRSEGSLLPKHLASTSKIFCGLIQQVLEKLCFCEQSHRSQQHV